MKVHADAEDPQSKGRAYFEKFDVIIATELDLDNLVTLPLPLRYGGFIFFFADCFFFIKKRLELIPSLVPVAALSTLRRLLACMAMCLQT